jgi:hypothetical protein
MDSPIRLPVKAGSVYFIGKVLSICVTVHLEIDSAGTTEKAVET